MTRRTGPDKGTRQTSGLRVPFPRDELASAFITDALVSGRLTYEDEASLHTAISAVLTDAGIEHEHEVRLDARSRIDFLTANGVGIEVKVAGTAATAARQLLRYAHHEEVRELVLVTTQASHYSVPAVLFGKTVRIAQLLGQGL